MKYIKSTTSGWKDKEFRKVEFVSKTQLLSFKICRENFFKNQSKFWPLKTQEIREKKCLYCGNCRYNVYLHVHLFQIRIRIVIAHIFKELKIRLFTTRGGVHYKTKEMKIDFFHTLLWVVTYKENSRTSFVVNKQYLRNSNFEFSPSLTAIPSIFYNLRYCWQKNFLIVFLTRLSVKPFLEFSF